MSTLELKLVLPDSLAREAEGSGLLTPESIESFIMVSGLLWRGSPRQILDAARNGWMK